MEGFWKNLPKPFFVLAPMADVTDAAFRFLIAKYGKPSAMWTEFVSADGLLSAGHDALVKDLQYDKTERPIVAQLFTSKPEHMEHAATMMQEMGFDGFDINMGCPDKAIEKQGCGSALIKTPELAQELIAAAKRGAPKLPVSVKTRIGYLKNELDTWLPALLEAKPAAVTLHLRTRKEMSKVPAHWELAADAVRIRDEMKSNALIVGNGDVLTLEDAQRKIDETGVDGVMIGKGIFGNPWFFSDKKPTVDEKLRVLVEHCKLFEKLVSHKRFQIMKKHFKAYVQGWDGAKELRMKLMECENADEVETIVVRYLEQ
ncbi:MAG: tRNA-dihydrouridine synthase [Parcubacteria group bacterium CG10_big_fil_rev_8_21_14_0_10_46_32]|nr:MAG: tRNA-dihydrouridine synthase [Parcubacteria group bacterium CG10_big_fil_rev_8_21_14_0_10_46_32]